MISHYFREQQRYTKNEIVKALGIEEDKVNAVLRRLKEYGIVKTTRGEKKDLSSLLDDAEEISDVESSGNEVFYVFSFVGVTVVNGIVFKIYPKYLPPDVAPGKEFKQVIAVLTEYDKRKAIVRIFNESDEDRSFNLLAIMLYLMQDYWVNGLYTNTEHIREQNGEGEIIWDRTINESFAFIHNNRPYYLELQTRKTRVDDYDFFMRLHECILTEISNQLKNTKDPNDADDFSLLELFELEEIDISDENRSSFGETSYILYRIEKELAVQFNTRKQNTLKALYTYLSLDKKFESTDGFSLFGTTAFHSVWEDVCSTILDNHLHKTLLELPIKGGLKKPYSSRSKEKLIDLIDKPFWDYVGSGNEGYSSKTLEPDIISIVDEEQNSFIIFDAKYYVPTIEKGKPPQNIPGIEDITKQYLYQMAYKGFLRAHGINYVSNCFIIPDSSTEISTNKGHVIIKFLYNAGLENIQIRFLSAEKAYEYYLSGKKLKICELKLDPFCHHPVVVKYGTRRLKDARVAEKINTYTTPNNCDK